MKRTGLSTILWFAVGGAVAGAFLQTLLAGNGFRIVTLPVTLAVALAVIGGIIVSLAIPIKRMTLKHSAPRVDPFYATRVLMLAKASTVTGALVAGFGIGVLAYLLTRTIIGVGSVPQAIATILGAGVLLAGGLVSEHLCRIPPSDDENDHGKQPADA